MDSPALDRLSSLAGRAGRAHLSRRGLLRGGIGAAAAAAGAFIAGCVPTTLPGRQTMGGVSLAHQHHTGDVPLAGAHGLHETPLAGDVAARLSRLQGFDPMTFLTAFDYGRVSTLPDGRTLREYEVISSNKNLEVAPGVMFPAWTFNDQVPGPTIRATEGDVIRVHFTNGGDHPHTMHFHGIHPANMDGVFENVEPEGSFTYEFDAEPFGLHLYHCHTMPLAKHIAKGLYGAMVIDPRAGRPRADREFVMVQMGFDVDFDGENEFYAVNGPAFFYQNNPIKIKVGELIRIYLVNILEFDQINSFHLHANFFNYYPTGTSLQPAEFTDTIVQGQGQRGILEFRYKHPGKFMFHAHKTEFAELGWAGFFQVEP
ncbi:MAG: multicopper oxidase domain-containing protein [Chloroflexi bacterium]|nr:multicopper oxidase domain-containing protein [Chloroflexota bacterium]